MHAITAQAKRTGMPPIGRSIHAPRLAPRSGSACLSECSFSLPLRPSHQPGEEGYYSASLIGWEAARTLPPIWSAIWQM